MAEPTMDTLPARLSSELPHSEEDVELSFTHEGPNFWLHAVAHFKDEDGDWQDMSFDLMTLMPGKGLILHPGLWQKLGFALSDDLKLKVVDGNMQELALVPAETFKKLLDIAGEKLKTGKDKEVVCDVTADGITYRLENLGDRVKLWSPQVPAGNILVIGKKRGIERMNSLSEKLGLPRDEDTNRIKVTR